MSDARPVATGLDLPHPRSQPPPAASLAVLFSGTVVMPKVIQNSPPIPMRRREEHPALPPDVSAVVIATETVPGISDRPRSAASLVTAEDLQSRRHEFMSSLSHSFRTPLHNIYGYAQLLASGIRGPLTGEQRYDVERIQANERHLLCLVEAVISFARWDVAAPLSLEDVSVLGAVRRTNEVVVRAALKKGVVYDPEVVIAEDVIVRAEPIRLHEILLQLMLNAVQFSRSGDTVSVCAVPVGDRIWIRVTDTGVGIASSDLALIFQPFQRAAMPEQLLEGVGLGLTITQTLARAMDGDLSVVSEEGRGSTFTLSLARGRVHPESDAG